MEGGGVGVGSGGGVSSCRDGILGVDVGFGVEKWDS